MFRWSNKAFTGGVTGWWVFGLFSHEICISGTGRFQEFEPRTEIFSVPLFFVRLVAVFLEFRERVIWFSNGIREKVLLVWRTVDEVRIFLGKFRCIFLGRLKENILVDISSFLLFVCLTFVLWTNGRRFGNGLETGICFC